MPGRKRAAEGPTHSIRQKIVHKLEDTYALGNGSERAQRKFSNLIFQLESTIQNFKKAYKEKLDGQKKKLHPEAVTSTERQSVGRPPLLGELDAKLITFLKALRHRGGVINIHIVCASAQALMDSHQGSTSVLQLQSFSMPRSWVQSIYRRMGFAKRMGTTSRPPVPRGLYEECPLQFLSKI